MYSLILKSYLIVIILLLYDEFCLLRLDHKVECIGDKGQQAYGLGQLHQHVQHHHPEVLGRLQALIQVKVLILIHIPCRHCFLLLKSYCLPISSRVGG